VKLTTKSEYALLALSYMARNWKREARLFSVKEVADRSGVPARFLQQILQTLRMHRILTSSRGKNGGFGLARAPDEITLAEVVRLFDGPLAPVSAASKFFYQPSPLEKNKKVMRLFRDIRNYISIKMEETTLADIS